MDLLAVLVEGPVGLRGARRGGVWKLSLARGGARAIRGVGGVSPGAVSIKFAVDGAAAGACEGLWEAGGHPKRCQGRTFGSFLMRRGGIVKKGCACAAVARKSECACAEMVSPKAAGHFQLGSARAQVCGQLVPWRVSVWMSGSKATTFWSGTSAC